MSSTLTAATPADLLHLPQPANGRHYELSAGELIVVGNAGARHERVKQRILTALIVWASQHQPGSIFAESQFTLNDHTARIPDVAFAGPGKLALLPDADVPIPFAPDLAVEVISESESAADAETKVQEYLNSGVAEVWQVYPRTSTSLPRYCPAFKSLFAISSAVDHHCPSFASNSHFSPKNPAAAIFPGHFGSGGTVKSTTA
jgi:Uma2 family endonuclease